MPALTQKHNLSQLFFGFCFPFSCAFGNTQIIKIRNTFGLSLSFTDSKINSF